MWITWKEGRILIKEMAALLGAAAATGTLRDPHDVTELMAGSLETIADRMDQLSELLEEYASKE